MSKSFIVSIDYTVDLITHKAVLTHLENFKTSDNLFMFSYDEYQEFVEMCEYVDLHLIRFEGMTINIMILTNKM